MATNDRKKSKTAGRSAASPAKKTGKAAAKQKPPAGKAAKSGKVAAPGKTAPKPGAKPKKTAPAKTKAAPKNAAAKKGSGRKGSVDRPKAGKAVAKPKRKKRGEPSVPPPPPSSKRNFGLRGAAPWVARHAAKHAEELRKRNAEPPPPGSARATLRVPPQAEQIKTKVSQLHQLIGQIRNLRKRLDKGFFEIGELLAQVQLGELHVAKGYASFESFLDREIDLPRSLSLKLIRISHTFQKETAYDFGLERLTSALAALDGEISQPAPSHPSSRGFSSTALPPKPPIRYDE